MKDFYQEYSVFQEALNIEDPWYVVKYNLDKLEQCLQTFVFTLSA